MQAIAKLTNGVIDNYCVVASDAIVVAEFFLLLEEEVRYFWSTRLTGATLLFFASRYISLVYALYTCIVVPEAADALDFSRYAVWAAFSSLRTLALLKLRLGQREWSGRAIALLVFLLSMVPCGISFSGYAFTKPAEVAPGVCADAITWSAELSMNCKGGELAIASRTCLIAADLLVVYMTWYTLVWSDAARGRMKSRRLTFSGVLVTDGVLCFLALCVMNILHVALTVSAITDPSSGHSYVTVFTQPITSILVSRFLLHLQRANVEAEQDRGSSELDTGGAQISTVRFERAMGSIGYVPGGGAGGGEHELDGHRGDEERFDHR
ncbi:uncharacterized protein BXZ73DRAFT_108059 [Epithele typhae]|uniref:uncharacterized protein n=1 Tax=Epithele typhae TaxID=378194 RepID=UPI002007D195|nr:uncharacterized protein BXZ73DRAFT_108059 [Epithele typhae]KAH9911361.1 hypothetical protein BXZ73DRAFT_108059 [Epithele typhae]